MRFPRTLATVFLAAVSPATLAVAFQGDPSPEESFRDPFAGLPLTALQYRSRPVGEWIELFRESKGTSREALWSVFYWDDRSPEVIEFLREELKRSWEVYPPRHQDIVGWNTSTAGTLRREVDAILDHWGVEHECLGMKEYWDPSMYSYLSKPRRTVDAFPPPVPLLEASNEALVELLRSGVGDERGRAALTLIARQHEVSVAVRAHVHHLYATGPARDESLWVWRFARSATERALAELLADPAESVAVKAFLLDEVGLRAMAWQRIQDERALPPVLAELALEGPLAESARRELFALCDVETPRYALGDFDVRSTRAGVISMERPFIEKLLARVVRAYLEADPRERGVRLTEGILRCFAVGGNSVGPTLADRYDAQRLFEIRQAVHRSELVLAAARPWLIETLDRPGLVGREALRLLCLAGEHGPEVRAAYRRALDGMERFDEETLDAMPCLGQHDAETLASLKRVFERAERKDLLYCQIVAGGLLDTSREDGIARTLVDYAERSGVNLWCWLHHDGYEGTCTLRPEDEKVTRVDKLILNASSKASRGEEVSQELAGLWKILEDGYHEQGLSSFGWYERAIWEVGKLDPDEARFADWGIALMLDFWKTWDYHTLAVADILAKRELTRRQQAALCHADVTVLDDDWGSFFASQGEAAIERVVDVRRRAYLGRMKDLRNVLKITRMSTLDESVLLQGLEQGAARDRELGLEIIGELDLDTPALREAALARTGDCDDDVRAAAKALRDARGW